MGDSLELSLTKILWNVESNSSIGEPVQKAAHSSGVWQ